MTNLNLTLFTKKQFKKHIQFSQIYYGDYQISAGTIKIFFTDIGIFEASFDHLSHFSNSAPLVKKEIPLNHIILIGTAFQVKVWQEILKIPSSALINYQELAIKIGHPKATRTVAKAISQNKIAYLIPCHRVIRKNGKLGGYKWGIERKAALLKAEQISINY